MKIETKVDSELSHAVTNIEDYDYEFLNDTIHDRINLMANLYPNDVPFIFEQNGGLKLTYIELKRKVEVMAHNLLSLSFQKGDRFAFQLPNTVETLVSTIACGYIGVISVAIDPLQINNSLELEYILEKVNPRGLVLMVSFNDIYYYNLFRQICPQIDKSELDTSLLKFNNLKHVFLAKKLENLPLVEDLTCNYSHLHNFEEIFNENTNFGSSKYELPNLDPHDPIFISFTSGTTGRNKAPITTFYKYANNFKLANLALGNSISWLKKSCNVFSMHHAASRCMSLIPALVSNTSQTVFPSFTRNIKNTLETISKHKCTTLIGPPMFLLNLIVSPQFAQYDTSSIKYVVAASQIITIELIEKAFENFKNLKNFLVMFGMSEILIGAMLSIDDPKKWSQATLSIGRPGPFFQFKIVDPKSGATLPLNNIGELYVKNFATFISYWEDPEKTKDAFTEDQWLFKTGDMAKMDKSGYVYYKNRQKEVITIENIQYFPSEIEALLRMHENVLDANVFSISENGNERYICAWIILKDITKNTNVEDMKNMCKTIPLKFVKFVNQFIVNSVSKVLKSEMAESYKKELNLSF